MVIRKFNTFPARGTLARFYGMPGATPGAGIPKRSTQKTGGEKGMKNKVLSRENELKKIQAGKIFSWYKNTLQHVNGENLQYIPYEYRGAAARMELSIRFQTENAKMQPTDKIAFLIFSLPAVLTCPGATAQCMHFCYARRDERFQRTRASRLSNFVLSLRPDFVCIVERAIIDAVFQIDGKMRAAFRGKKIIVRVHESGDFYNLAYMRAWFEIARRFPKFKFFAYTKSFDILSECINEQPKNFVLRASIWNDTRDADLDFITRHNLPFYQVLQDIAGYSKKNQCDCVGGCGACGCKCSNAALIPIVNKLH